MKTYLLLFLLILSSCGQNCNNLPNSYKNYEEAKTIVLNTSFKFTDDCYVYDSSLIESANYYSCDGVTGYLILGIINDKKYIFQNIPFDVWNDFKNAESKGKFYNAKIKGRFKLRLK